MTKTTKRPSKIVPPDSPMTERLRELRKLIPSAFVDGALDVQVIQQMTGAEVAAEDRYRFQWAGGKESFKTLRVPAAGALTPRCEDSVDFDNTKNLYIEGDNLEVLKLMRNAYTGRVKMIYIDPPYNTGKDFVYADNFRDPLAQYLQTTGQVDKEGNAKSARARADEQKVNGRKHSKWMAMMFPRLFIARSLLREDGVIFVSIDDNEVHHLRLLMNLVFGEENFESIISWRRRNNQPNDAPKMIAKVSEFVMVYAKNSDAIISGKSFNKVPLSENRLADYSNPDNDPRGEWSSTPWKASLGQGGSNYSLITPAGVVYEGPWLGKEETYQRLLKEKIIYFPDNGKGKPRKKIFKSERVAEGQPAINFWLGEELGDIWFGGEFGDNLSANTELKSLFGEKNRIYDYSKPVNLLKTIARIATNPDSVVMDFFAGSGTAAHAIMQLNAEDGGKRQCISVQMAEKTPEDSEACKEGYNNIAQIGRERLRRAGKQIRESQNGNTFGKDVDIGFRAFALTPSAFKQWRGTSEATPESLTDTQMEFVNLVRDDGDEEALLYESMLSFALPLTAEREKVQVGKNTVWKITDDGNAEKSPVYVCLDHKLMENLHIQLGLSQQDTLIVRDSALTESMAAGMAGQCDLKAV